MCNRKAILVLVVSAAFSCGATSEKLPEEYSPYTLCSGIVDYDFYVPEGSSLDSLNALAISMMSPSWAFLKAQCKSDMKRLTCSMVYQPLQENDGEVGPVKPCRSLCDLTSFQGTSCAGMMESFGTAMNCSSDMFEQNNTNCNLMQHTEGDLLVAEDKEYYTGSTCEGVIATEIATPSVKSIDPNFAPYLPPYVAQSIVETALATWVNSMPIMAHGACLTNFRKMACGVMLPIAEPTLALDYMFGELTMPSFPHYSICTDYMTSCASTLAIVPQLNMNCSAKNGDISLFPKEVQTIISVNVGFGDVLLQSEPNMMQNTTLELQTECPYALTVPQDPEGKNVNWIEGFNCALECPAKIFPDSFSNQYFNFFKGAQWASLVMITFAAVNLQYLTSKPKRNPYLQLILGALWLQALLTLLLTERREQKDVICKDNAQSYSYNDFGSSSGATACSMFATYMVFHDNTLYFAFIAMTSELFCRVILEAKKVDFHKKFYIYGAGSVLLGLSILQLCFPGEKNVTQVDGAWAFTCLWTYEDRMVNYWLQTFPKIVIYVICSAMSFQTAYKTIRVSRAVSGSFQKMWKTYRVLFVSLILFVGSFPFSLFLDKTYYGVVMGDTFDKSNSNWFTCIISEFLRGEDPLASCGDRAETHYPTTLLYFMIAFYYVLLPLGNVWASLSKEAREYWFQCAMKLHAAKQRYLLNDSDTKVAPEVSQSKTPPSSGRDQESGTETKEYEKPRVCDGEDCVQEFNERGDQSVNSNENNV